MIQQLFEAFLIACIGSLIAELSGIMQYLKWKASRIVLNYKPKGSTCLMGRWKPFDCPLCLSFWICLIYELHKSPDLLFIIGLPCLSSIFAIWITQLTNNLTHTGKS